MPTLLAPVVVVRSSKRQSVEQFFNLYLLEQVLFVITCESQSDMGWDMFSLGHANFFLSKL